MAESPKTRQILVVGGGFGGVRAAERLARYREFEVTLLSDSDSFAYYPQLYHSATGGARSESSLPLASLLPANVKLVRDTAASLDPESGTLQASSGKAYRYDELVLALGSVTNYFGIKGLPEFSYDIKSIAGAERFKQHLHKELIDDKKPDINYVVVGGGPTGVELAAALGAYLQRITRLHGIAQPKYRVDLIEAAPRLLPRSAESVSARVQKRLQSLGVTVMTGKTVKAETAAALELDGEKLASKTVVWTAGVSTNAFYKNNAPVFTFAKNGKVQVDEHLQVHEHIYVIGDNAFTKFSGMAQTAIADANYVTDDLLRRFHNHPRRTYIPSAPVSVIPVGADWASVEWGPLRLFGWPGAVLRRLADLVAYIDIESIPKAVSVWLQDSRRQDLCPICSATEPAS
jgi:NADH:ubiquinone reductase (H+-translocating)